MRCASWRASAAGGPAGGALEAGEKLEMVDAQSTQTKVHSYRKITLNQEILFYYYYNKETWKRLSTTTILVSSNQNDPTRIPETKSDQLILIPWHRPACS